MLVGISGDQAKRHAFLVYAGAYLIDLMLHLVPGIRGE